MTTNKTLTILSLIVGTALVVGCSEERRVSFKREVMPILKQNCVGCHLPPSSEGFQKSGLSLESYETLMKGTKLGTIIVAGSSLNSSLNRMIEGRVDPSIRMPHGGKQLPAKDVETMKLWVNQGAKNN
ncbi:MAG: hypothetical protein BWK79_06895 [Beggiatoa sp. IS2]|nr:MAG: hypothetical protein BWK79_06895 [Beggiatoa sp. IS2]